MMHVTAGRRVCACTPARSRLLHAGTRSPTSRSALNACAVPIALFLLISLFAGGIFVGSAEAATWPLSVSRLSPSAGFHETYTAGGKSYVHSGMDIPASAGLQISTPLAGTVRYAGAVPSGDSRIGASGSGPTMHAVSLELSDGRIITLMPFAQTFVGKGQTVGEGDALGTLAASGDISTSGAHLHMGLKRGGVYCDPMSLFSATGTNADGSASASAAAGAQGWPSASEGVAAPAARQPHAQTDGAAAPRTPEPAAGRDAGAPAPEPGFELITSGDACIPQHAAERSGVAEQLAGVLAPIFQACALQTEGMLAAFEPLSHLTGIPVVFLVTFCATLLVAALACLAAMLAKTVAPRVRRMWRARDALLLNGKADGTMP